jgi:uncharacterized protein YkwD
MPVRMRALTVSIVLSGCYAGVGDEVGDELATAGSEDEDESGDGDGDAGTSTTSDDDDAGTSTTVDDDDDDDADTDAGTSTTLDDDADTDTEADTSTTLDDDAETDTETETSTTGGPEGCSADAIELINLVNVYRGENGLPAIPASPSLCEVSTLHVHDLSDNSPHTQPGGCNLHSWSDQGPWSPCCYTPDHAQAQCMWDKPTELTVYPGYGYENAASGVGSPAQALDLWKSSQGHNEVILNLGIWTNHPWQAIGADVYQGYSVLWFGEQVDPG